MHICNWCNQSFEGYRYKTPVFCSRSCSGKNARKKSPKKRKGILFNCSQCSKEAYSFICRKEEKRFCSRKCQYQFLKQTNEWGFKKGERPMPSNPYKRITVNGKSVAEHRIIMERHLGRSLSKNEHVHHINSNPLDNRLENLTVLSSQEHLRLHKK